MTPVSGEVPEAFHLHSMARGGSSHYRTVRRRHTDSNSPSCHYSEGPSQLRANSAFCFHEGVSTPCCDSPERSATKMFRTLDQWSYSSQFYRLTESSNPLLLTVFCMLPAPGLDRAETNGDVATGHIAVSTMSSSHLVMMCSLSVSPLLISRELQLQPESRYYRMSSWSVPVSCASSHYKSESAIRDSEGLANWRAHIHTSRVSHVVTNYRFIAVTEYRTSTG